MLFLYKATHDHLGLPCSTLICSQTVGYMLGRRRETYIYIMSKNKVSNFPLTTHVHLLTQVDDGEMAFTFAEVKKALTRRSIEQLGFVKHLDLNLLVVLSGDLCMLHA